VSNIYFCVRPLATLYDAECVLLAIAKFLIFNRTILGLVYSVSDSSVPPGIEIDTDRLSANLHATDCEAAFLALLC